MNSFESIREQEDKFQIATYSKMPMAIERGRGARVWTSDGAEYLDLYGGHAVCATGHSHEHVVEAIKRQADQVLFYSNLVYSSIRGKAAEKLVSVAPRSITEVFFCNSGTEANENAMRMARMATGREKIVSFTGGFHGRTADSISATFLGKYRDIGKPNVPMHVSAEFGDIESVKLAVDETTAAVIIEPIQSMAGVREASPDFFVALRQVCNDNGAVLIFDEVQTGIGRTGRWFFSGGPHSGSVEADVITLAKSLGSGVPVGACLVNDGVAAGIKENDLGTTFGGGMLAMAAILATLEAIEQDSMLENAAAIEKKVRESAEEWQGVESIKGKGCLLGIEFAGPAREAHAELLANNIITGTSSDPKVLRLLPPLCLPLGEIDRLSEVMNAR